MLSGIGPAAQLAFHDVPPLVDLPGVGEHLMDHPVIDINVLDKSGHTLGWMRKTTGLSLELISAILQWSWRGTGPLTTSVSDCIEINRRLTTHTHAVSRIQVAEGMAFARADDPKLFPNSEEPLAEDSTSGPECPDLELLVSPLGYNTVTAASFTEPAFGVHAVALRPTSLGTVRLKSNDPFDSPVIDPRFVDCAAARLATDDRPVGTCPHNTTCKC